MTDLGSLAVEVTVLMIVIPIGIVTIINVVAALKLAIAVRHKRKKCNDIKELE